MSRDSLYNVIDSMAYTPVDARGMYGPGSELASGDVSLMGGYREATAEEMFGDSAVLECHNPITPLEPTLIDDWLFQLLAICGFVVYLYILLRSWNFMGSIWGGVLFRRSERRMRDEGGELPLNRFKRAATMLGILLSTLVVVRFIDIASVPESAVYSDGVAQLMPLYALFAVMLVVVWLYLLHKTIGVVTRSEIMGELAAIAVMNFVRCIAIIYPLVTIWLLAPTAALSTWSIVLDILALLALLIYLKDTFLLFVGKKISILNWILYLCAAILLPVSFACRIIPLVFG